MIGLNFGVSRCCIHTFQKVWLHLERGLCTFGNRSYPCLVFFYFLCCYVLNVSLSYEISEFGGALYTYSYKEPTCEG